MNKHVDNPFQSPAIISFCTGGRMLENGLKRSIGNFTVAAYVEIEAFCIFNLVAQMEQGVVDPAPIWTDCKTFPATAFHRKIHGIIGGYPCQPFSVSGQRKGENDPRHLWPYLRGHIKAIGPVWCYFENVDDHLSLGFNTVYKELSDLGYRVEAGIYSAAEVGAPHEHQRLFILAVLADAYSYLGRLSECEPGQTRGKQGNSIEFKGSGKAVADTTSGAPGRLPIGEGKEKPLPGFNHQNVPDTNGQRSQQLPPESGQPGRTEFNSDGHQGRTANINLDNTNGQRLGQEPTSSTQKQSRALHYQGQRLNLYRETGRSNTAIQWPSTPGREQELWEEPRTVKPGMGCTVDGYNFKDDLLRMLGNGVVEQAAELSFNLLLEKHIKNAHAYLR